MPPRQQLVSEVYATGLSLPTRSILICEDIDDSTVKQVWTGLQSLDREDSVINVYICSGGGFVNAGFAIYDMLYNAAAYIRTIGMGRVYSMASILLQAGDERILLPNASMMLHPVIGQVEDLGILQMVQEVEEYKKLEEKTIAILAKALSITPNQYKNRYKGNCYFNAEEAVRVGLADSVQTI